MTPWLACKFATFLILATFQFHWLARAWRMVSRWDTDDGTSPQVKAEAAWIRRRGLVLAGLFMVWGVAGILATLAWPR